MRDGRGQLLPTLAAAHAAAWLCLALSSCGQGLLTDMSRSSGDPSVVAPTVQSLRAENQIQVGWQADSNADGYVLERAVDAGAPSWTTVYSGTGTTYADGNCADQERYLYRLTKTRGSASFGPSNVVLGVASATSQDGYEPNDSEESATALDYKKIANLYYYCSTYQQGGAALSVQDRDWYAVTINPRMTAEIVVMESTLDAGATVTHITFHQKGLAPKEVDQGNPIDVVNSSYSPATFYFELYPDAGQFQTAGGMVIGYSIWVDRTVAN